MPMSSVQPSPPFWLLLTRLHFFPQRDWAHWRWPGIPHHLYRRIQKVVWGYAPRLYSHKNPPDSNAIDIQERFLCRSSVITPSPCCPVQWLMLFQVLRNLRHRKSEKWRSETRRWRKNSLKWSEHRGTVNRGPSSELCYVTYLVNTTLHITFFSYRWHSSCHEEESKNARSRIPLVLFLPCPQNRTRKSLCNLRTLKLCRVDFTRRQRFLTFYLRGIVYV